MKDPGQQAQHEDVLPLVLRGSPKRLDGQPRDRNPNMDELLLVRVRLDVVGIIEQDSTIAKKANMVLVAVLMEGDEEVRFVSRREDFARSDAHLEDRGTARNRGGDCHVGHDFLSAAAGQSREHGAGGLDAVLGISGEPNDGVANALRPQIGPETSDIGGRCVLQNREKTHE